MVAFALTACDTTAEKAASAPAASSSPVMSANAEQEVAQMERAWSAAMSKQDIDTLSKFMADDGVFVSQTKGFNTKAESVARIKENFEKWKTEKTTSTETVDEVKVKINGETVVAYGRGTSKEEKGGKTETETFLFTDVAAKRNGQWQFIAMTTTVVKPETKSATAPPTGKKK